MLDPIPLMSPKLGPGSTKSSRNLTNICPEFTDNGLGWNEFCRTRPDSHDWPGFGQIRATIAKFNQNWPDIGQDWAEIGRVVRDHDYIVAD